VSKGEFSSVQDAWLQFWGVVAQHFRPVLATPAGRAHIERCDTIFFHALLSLLITDVLAGLAADLTKDLRYLAKCLEPWLKVFAVLLFSKKLQTRGVLHVTFLVGSGGYGGLPS
jgi:hypothetical protein